MQHESCQRSTWESSTANALDAALDVPRSLLACRVAKHTVTQGAGQHVPPSSFSREGASQQVELAYFDNAWLVEPPRAAKQRERYDRVAARTYDAVLMKDGLCVCQCTGLSVLETCAGCGGHSASTKATARSNSVCKCR